MSTVEEIEKVIERLPREEFLRLSDWVAEKAESAWDAQIEDDAAAGLLDGVAERAILEHRKGESQPIPPADDE